MAKSTIFKNFNQPIENKSIIVILKNIREGKYKNEVEHYQKLKREGNQVAADNAKKSLLAFTPSATYKDGRKAHLVDEYSGYVHLDFDKLSPEQMKAVFDKIKASPYTFACFISPSGNGYKVFVEVDSTAEQHESTYKQVQAHYEQLLGIVADAKCKDITRLCFVSYDPQSFTHVSAKKFVPQAQPILLESKPTDFTKKFERAIIFTNNKEQYVEGSRNNYIYLLACNCNRDGIPQMEAEQMILSKYDHENTAEVRKSIESAYKNNGSDFAKFANIAEAAISKPIITEATSEDYLKKSVTIPDHLFESLPDILKEGAKAFTERRKRDVFFTTALCIISGCLPKVKGIYSHETIYPHLFCFIIAPPASGKGVLKNAKRLGDQIHQSKREESKKMQEQFDLDNEEYKTYMRSKKKDAPKMEKPQEPQSKLLFIPADCSQAMMIQLLNENDGQGIICETEADAMGNAQKQDWGSYSHVMRGAFHHEKISVARKTNKELLEIAEPRLAVVLSGTPNQVPKLIASAEDGLFSRFMFYAFKNDIIWQDPRPQSGLNHTDHFKGLSQEMTRLQEFLSSSPTEIQLSTEQWDRLSETFNKYLTQVAVFTGEDAVSVVFRLGLIVYRMAMVFTALRKYENAELEPVVICDDTDFDNAIALSDVYLNHALLMFSNLAAQEESSLFKMPENKRKLFEALPQQFKRSEAIQIGGPLEISERSVDEFLANSIPKFLKKIKTGVYKKV